MKVRIKNNNTVYIMETIVFIGTVIMCTCIIVISETLDRISSIEKYIKSQETVLQIETEKHILMCILYKAVHIPELIYGFKITIHGGFVSFKDVCIVDIKEQQVAYKINRQKATSGYRYNPCNADENQYLEVEFYPVLFKYIEFYDLKFYPGFICIIFLMEYREVSINIRQKESIYIKQKEKNIICNTAAYHSTMLI
jgi:hypothetical protein